MQKAELEYLVNTRIDLALDGIQPEDTPVEFKAAWVEPVKMARIIAGHANASYPDSFILVIGFDEKGKAVHQRTDC